MEVMKMPNKAVYLLQDFEKDHLWVQGHWRKLLSNYKNKWVAIRNQKVIDSEKDIRLLCSRLKDPGNTCVEYITDEPLEMILWL
jgi:hypothetical protein